MMADRMSPVVTVLAGALVVLALLLLGLVWQRRRLAKRFARRISPYTRTHVPPAEVTDPEEWIPR
jgi:cytochrome oxidase assembly protein ShyY1